MDRKDQIITELRQLVADLQRHIQRQDRRIAELELELAKSKKDSSNSSKSPSSDIVKPPKMKTDRRKKAKRGGQKGHSRKLREPLPPERVDEQITYEMNADDVRELGLTSTDDFEIIQHIELLEPADPCHRTSLTKVPRSSRPYGSATRA